MNGKEFAKQINHLNSIARYGPPLTGFGPDAFIKVFSIGSETVSFISVGVLNDFNKVIERVFVSEAFFSKSYSLTVFEKQVCETLLLIHIEQRQADASDWDLFMERLKAVPDITVKVVAPIYGVTLKKPSVQLGPFNIYSKGKLLKTINEKSIPTELGNSFDFLKDSPLIEIDVTAKDGDRCYELANLAFLRFENVCNYITGSFHNDSKVRIFNQSLPNSIECVFVLDKDITRSIKKGHLFNPVEIDNPFYLDSSINYDKIWWWITGKRNDLQEKILNSIEWCGRALVETDPSKALLQYIIAIESLLQQREGDFIVPSIVSQLSDMVAFLLGKDKQERIGYSKYIKELYEIRSKIAHAGYTSVTSLSLHTGHVLCKKIINKIISTEPFCSFTSKKELCTFLTNLKFG